MDSIVQNLNLNLSAGDNQSIREGNTTNDIDIKFSRDNTSVNPGGGHKAVTFDTLNKTKGFKIAHLNVRSIVKKMDQIWLHLFNSKIDIF